MAGEAVSDAMVAAGGCLCGAVRYEAHGEPKWTCYCHCHSCRHATGAPAAAFAGLEEGKFRLTRGEPQVFESSPGVWRSFCGRCGTPLTYRATRYPGEVHIHIGSLDEPDGFAPTAHVFYEEHICWFDIADGMKRIDKLSTKTS